MRPLILLPFLLAATSVAYADDPIPPTEETSTDPDPTWESVVDDQGVTATYIQLADVTLGAQCVDGNLQTAVVVKGAILRTDGFVLRVDDNEAQEFVAGGPDPGRLFVLDIDRFLDQLSSAQTGIRITITDAWSFGTNQYVTVDVTFPAAPAEHLDRVRVACGRAAYQKEPAAAVNPVLSDLFGR
jgi:hypothetical protein